MDDKGEDEVQKEKEVEKEGEMAVIKREDEVTVIKKENSRLRHQNALLLSCIGITIFLTGLFVLKPKLREDAHSSVQACLGSARALF